MMVVSIGNMIFHCEYPQKVRFMNILCLYLFAFQGMFIVCHQLTSSRISQWCCWLISNLVNDVYSESMNHIGYSLLH